MQTINACPRGHRYRANILHPGQVTTCPRCDRAALVALAYGDRQNPPRACRLLDFRTEGIVSFDEFSSLLQIAGPYNRFVPGVVEEAIRPIFPRLMSVEIGREGSPVVYAYVPFWRHQKIGHTDGPGERIPEEERKALATEFLEAMRRASADELSGNEHRLRAWWD